MKRPYYITDSYNINSESVELIKRLKLEEYFNYKDGNWKPEFVGFVLTEKEIIISFPKHYCGTDLIIKEEDIKLIGKLMIKTNYLEGLNNEFGSYNNFPLSSYLYICNYYKRYGLYNETRKKREEDYKGRIDWRNTIRRSNKVISGNNLVFIPFIVEKYISLEVLITECMIYVLDQGFHRFGKFFEIGININKKTKNPVFKNKDVVIKQLKFLKSEYFKDSERLLIDHLIRYFTWSNNNKNMTILITKNFAKYWESMVQAFINSNLYDIEKTGELSFKKNCKKHNFRKETEDIESLEVRESEISRNFSVEYDHLFITSDKVAYLFDSKYYKEIPALNYKQIAYFYILMSSPNFINKQVINGLILPTDKKYHYKVHLDTRDRVGLLEGLYIVEHYFNMKEVIISFVKS